MRSPPSTRWPAEMEDARADIERLAGLIADARRAVAFTGAGISTESGIPDFRSPTGIWSQTTPIYYEEFLASEEARIESWRRKFPFRDQPRDRPDLGRGGQRELRGESGESKCDTDSSDVLLFVRCSL